MASALTTVRNTVFGCFFGPPKHDQETNRERWDSRLAFILAASGSAIGLGNLWRFPQLAYQWGGGAFFIPYLLALFFIGIPLFVLELALGQVVQSGDVACFGSMHRRLRGVGFASVFGSFTVVCYYNVIIVWALVYLVNSFRSPLPWDVPEGATGEDVFKPSDDFFNNQVLQAGGTQASIIVGDNFGGLLFVWGAIAAIVWKGVSRTSKVVYVTMIVPLITLFILLIRGVTLEGAGDGVIQYIGQWDMSVLENGTVWSRAVVQIFFSIGVTFGIMTAYSSYNSRFQNVVADALIIAFTNSGVSIVAGFVVFSVLGWLSQRSGIPITSDDFPAVGGVFLAFATYPQALAEVPGANFFNFLFFLTLFFLGIDSAFSLVEAVCTAVKDSAKYNHLSRGAVTSIVSVTGFLIGCLYITNLGLDFLDVVDQYVNSGMILVGFMESFSSSWIYRIAEHTKICGDRAVYTLMAAWIGSTVIAVIIATLSIAWVGLLVGLLLCLFGSIAAVYLVEHNLPDDEAYEMWRHRSKEYTLFLFPIESLRADLNAVIKREGDGFDPDSKWAIPFVWSLFLRYFITPVLIIMLALELQGYVDTNGLADPVKAKYHAAGVVVFLVVVLLTFVPAIRPELLDGWIPAALSGVQTFGVLKPMRKQDKEHEDHRLLTEEHGATNKEEPESLTLSVEKGDHDEIELAAPAYNEDGAKLKKVSTESSLEETDDEKKDEGEVPV